MTRFLASVIGSEEAEIAVAGGVDIVDLKDPSKGAIGSLPIETVRRSVETVARRRETSAVAGAPSLSPEGLREAVREMAATGVDFVKVGLYEPDTRGHAQALSQAAAHIRLIGVLFAEHGAQPKRVASLRSAGFAGVLIDTVEKNGKRLLDHIAPAELRHFIEAARKAELTVGLAGALEAPDVARLLPLGPDILGFRGALCVGEDRAAQLDAGKLTLIRSLIPVDREASRPPADYRLLADRHYTREERPGAGLDRIHVRDFVLPMSIGAYRHEREKKQRVRFNVTAEVRRRTRPTDDMEGAFSYDVITDAIREVLETEHVAMVETAAERVAAAVLRHDAVRGVVVRVEKLDVGPGAVGIEIERRKSDETASVLELFPTSIGGAGPKAAS